jgi:hypothetical protein
MTCDRARLSPSEGSDEPGCTSSLSHIFCFDKDFYVALPILVQMTRVFLQHILLIYRIIVK